MSKILVTSALPYVNGVAHGRLFVAVRCLCQVYANVRA